MEGTELYRLLHDAFRVIDADFSAIDCDRSGFLSPHELINAFATRGVRDADSLEKLVRKVDTDHTGELAFSEFVTLLYYFSEHADYDQIYAKRDARAVGAAFGFLESAYIKFDADGSRKLSRGELGDFVETYFGAVPRGFDEECGKVFPKGDLRGELSFKMFLMLLYKITYPRGRYHVHRAGGGSHNQLNKNPDNNNNNNNNNGGKASGRMEDTDLFRLLSHAFDVVEQDFGRFDVDGDGVVDMHEMTEAMKKTDSSELVLAIAKLQQLFRDVDVDGSGYIDFSEFLYLVYNLAVDGSYRRVIEDAVDAAAVKKAFTFLRRCYSKYDKDHSNRLDRGETASFLRDYFGSVPQHFDDAFDRRQNPKKGTVDLVRFFSLLYELVRPDGRHAKEMRAANDPAARRGPPRRADGDGRGDLPQPTRGAKSPSASLERIDPLVISEISKGKELGKGGFGIVYKSMLRGNAVAAKFLTGEYGPETLKEFEGEVKLMERLVHPNLVFMIGHSCEPPELCIVTELCANGSLFDIIQKQGRRLTTPTVIRLAKEIAEGLNYLHTRRPPVIHRDIKSLNVLVDANMTAKVADFGLSTLDHGGTHTQGVLGTPLWSAPEVISSTKYSTKADVYSFAILLWELCHLSLPYNDVRGTVHQILYQVVSKNRRPRVSSRCDPRLAKVMQWCWHPDPRERPDMSAVITELSKF